MSEPGSTVSAPIVTKKSPRSVVETTARCVELANARGLKIFAVIDQSEEARRVGLVLRATTLVIFGSPNAGTPIMDASPLSGLDLPLKILVWDDDGETNVSYTTPSAIADRYHLEPELVKNLAGIEVLTDALIAP